MLNADTLKALQECLNSLQSFPENAPENFDVIYMELDGRVGDQKVTAQYEHDEWSISLDKSDSDDDEMSSDDPRKEEEHQDA